MKENYLSIKESDLENLLTEAGISRRFNPGMFDASKAALIVLDMQRYFCEESSHAFIPSVSAIINRILKLVEVVKSQNRPLFFTRHINTDENAAQMKNWWADLIRGNTPESELTAELEPIAENIIIKSQYDAFYNTNLKDELKNGGVKQVVISGVMTHLCCETTARSAFINGFEVFFLPDATATYNFEHHKATLLNLSHGFARLPFTSEIISTMEQP